MNFGLTNMPADFQKYINDILRSFLNVFCIAYLDNVLIFGETLEEHKVHVHKVMEALSAAGLHLKPEKCKFHKTEVEYLGIIISTEGIKMNQDKVNAGAEWETPANLTDVRLFLRFANFYRRFIKGYSEVVAPMV